MDLRDSLRRLQEFDSALLANTLDFVDPGPAAECYLSGDIQSVTPAVGPAVGVAFTAEVDTSTPEGGGWERGLYFQLVEQMEAAEVPAILVMKAIGSRPDHECVAGDGMAKMLQAAGCVGIVTDGRVRDVEAMQAVPFSVHARGRCVQHCAFRVKTASTPVQIGGLTISPGDVIHAGADGVLRLPKVSLDLLAEKASVVTTAEARAHAVLRSTQMPVSEKVGRVEKIYKELGLESAVEH